MESSEAVPFRQALREASIEAFGYVQSWLWTDAEKKAFSNQWFDRIFGMNPKEQAAHFRAKYDAETAAVFTGRCTRQQWLDDHPDALERHRQRNRDYYHANAEKRKAYYKAWRQSRKAQQD